MAIRSPQLQDISTWMSREQEQPVLKDEKVWKIGTPPENSLTWSILMSYLFSRLSIKSFHQLMNLLYLGDFQNEDFLNRLLKTVRNFNPFKNRYDFYPNPLMHLLLELLENRINDSMQENGIHGNEELHLQAASDYLQCYIAVYEIDFEGSKKFHPYYPRNISNRFKSLKRLILFKEPSKMINLTTQVFGFALSLEFSLILRQNTFVSIMQNSGIPLHALTCFKNLISVKNDFIFCALKSSCADMIQFLYKSPYIVKRLSKGGINIDPLSSDEHGFSPFYYCNCNSFLMQLLYHSALHNLSESDTRHPSDNTLTTLKEIKNKLKEDCLKSDSFSSFDSERESLQNIYSQFIRFNEYQCSIVQDNISIRTKYPCENVQQQIMISILDIYCDYFYYDSFSEKNAFQNYVKCYDYHDMIDQYTCFLFFDNIVKLTPIIDKNNLSIYTKAVKSLFLYILTNKKLSQNSRLFSKPITKPSKKAKTMDQFMSFLFRKDFQKCAVDLSKDLKCKELSKDLKCKELSKESKRIELKKDKELDVIRESIFGLPEIENEFFARKVSDYLSLVTVSISMRKSFSLERILQVFGELLCNEDVNDCSIKYLLSSCLPEGLESSLSLLRNHCLSKYRESSIQGRIKLERDDNKLKNVQKGIQLIYHVLRPILTSNFDRISEFLIKRCIDDSKKESFKIFKYIHKKYEQIFECRRILLDENKSYFETLSKNMFIYVRNYIEKNEKPKVTVVKGKIRALIYLTEYISILLNDNVDFLKDLSQRTENFSSIMSLNSEKLLREELKNKIVVDTLAILKSMHDNIFEKTDQLKINKGLKHFYFENFMQSILSIIFKYLRIIEMEIDVDFEEMGEELLNVTSGAFSPNEELFNRLINICESLTNRLISLNVLNVESNDAKKFLDSFKLTFVKIHQLNTSFDDDEMSSNLLILNNLLSDIKDYDIFSNSEKRKFKKLIIKQMQKSNKKKKDATRILENLKNNDIKTSTDTVDIENIIMPRKSRLNILLHIDKLKIEKALKEINCLPDENFKIEATENLTTELMALFKEGKYKTMKIKNIDIILNKLNSLPDENFEIETNENFTTKLMTLFEKEKYKTMFMKMYLPFKLKEKVYQIMNQKLYFLIDRTKQLKNILIAGDEEMKKLWPLRVRTNVRKYIIFSMCEKFLQNKETRTTLEMLFYDCLSILDDEELTEIWEKTANLFSGINLREFLAHGSPVAELVIAYLDPTDALTTLIDKILILIEDRKVMINLTKLWKKYKPSKFKDLEEILAYSDVDDKFCIVRRIKSCERWKKYLPLLPLEL